MVNKSLAETLELPERCEDEDASAAILSLIVSATQGSAPQLTLEEICRIVSQTGSAYLLDALGVLPSLLSCKGQAAADLIALVGECASAKEVVIAVQEALERLDAILLSGDDERDEELQEDSADSSSPSPIDQLTTLIALCTSSIPRLKYRNRSPGDALRPLITDLNTTLKLAAGLASNSECQEVISRVSDLVLNAARWAEGQPEGGLLSCKDILKVLLDIAVEGFTKPSAPKLAATAFAACFPRLMRQRPGEQSHPKQERIETESVSEALTALDVLGVSTTELLSTPSISSLIFLAHSPSLISAPLPDPESFLATFLPTILASLSGNIALDETLSLLLPILSTPNLILPTTIVTPLVGHLTPLSSVHPQPDVRHIAFRTLALVLERSAPPLHLQLLADLASDDDFPQMRAAAVGLIKEAVLDALAIADSKSKDNGDGGANADVFASQTALQVLSPLVFRPMPHDLFRKESSLSLQEFTESLELAREVECLMLFYILLMRDVNNRTGVRHPQFIAEVEKMFLNPLRKAVGIWELEQGDLALETIGPLVLGLERVDEAIGKVRN